MNSHVRAEKTLKKFQVYAILTMRFLDVKGTISFHSVAGFLFVTPINSDFGTKHQKNLNSLSADIIIVPSVEPINKQATQFEFI